MIFGVPLAVLSGQLLIGVINGAFYALLSLGLVVIFGLLKIINFAPVRGPRVYLLFPLSY